MKYGDILGMRPFPTGRAMAVCPTGDSDTWGEIWNAVVLADEEEPVSSRWAIGSIITLSDNDRDLYVIEES